MMRWLLEACIDCYYYFEPLLLKGLNMSLTASYCALAVMVLRLLLKKQPKVYSYALWLIVAFRLVCPVSVETRFSWMRMSPESIPADITSQHVPTVSTGIGGVDVAVNRILTNFESSVNPLSIWMFAGSILWLLVAAGLFGYGIGSYLKMHKELIGAENTEPGVWVSERLKTPFVLGFFKPVIYLPAGLTGGEKAYVLEHERIHIKRGDHLVKAGAFLLLCLHWFNPVLWASYLLMCKDMEMSCDEKVIRKNSFGTSEECKKEYSYTLLALGGDAGRVWGSIDFGTGNIRSRIKNVLQYKEKTIIKKIILGLFAIVVMLGLTSNPQKFLAECTNETSYAELIGKSKVSESGSGSVCGKITNAIESNSYFSIELPQEYEEQLCYIVRIENQKVQEISFYDSDVFDIDKENMNDVDEKNSYSGWIGGYYYSNTGYEWRSVIDGKKEKMTDSMVELCDLLLNAQIEIYSE